MAKQYFVRYTVNAEADLARGYSFVGYRLFATADAALEDYADLSGDAYKSEDFNQTKYNQDNLWRVGRDNITGLWGIRRSGLCGFGPFESVEDAARMPFEDWQYNGERAIFEGVSVCDRDFDGQDDGKTFAPVAIVY